MVTKHTSSVVPANLPAEFIERKIYMIRGHKVILDSDLADLYQVPTYRLNEAVKRNINRFPEDFMLQLTEKDVNVLTSQIAISNLTFKNNISEIEGRGGRRTLPYAFTEHGVAMLSSVLRSQRAVQMNISIIRAFIAMRGTLTILEAGAEIEMIKADQREHWKQIVSLRDIVVQIINPPEKQKNNI